MRICIVNGVLSWKNPRQTCMSKHRWMLGWPYCHWPRYNGLVYYLINLGDLSLSPIPTLSLLMTLLCKVINVPIHTLTGTDFYMYSQWGTRLGQVNHWVMWSSIFVSLIKFTVTTHCSKLVWMQSSCARHVNITFMFLTLSHNLHGRTRPKNRSKSSKVEHIGAWQDGWFQNAFGVLY